MRLPFRHTGNSLPPFTYEDNDDRIAIVRYFLCKRKRENYTALLCNDSIRFQAILSTIRHVVLSVTVEHGRGN